MLLSLRVLWVKMFIRRRYLVILLFGFTYINWSNTENSPKSRQFNQHQQNYLSDSIITEAANNTIQDNRTNEFLDWIFHISGIGTTTTSTQAPPPSGPPIDCDKSCVCGKMNQRNRIVGGQVTKVNQYPWMTMLIYGGRFYCGATLINDRYVLTAAHCVHGFKPENIVVRLLEHDRNENSETTIIDRKVAYIIRHKHYNQYNYDSDIALLKLDIPIPINDPLRPVCLPVLGKSYVGYEGIVTGWGATSEGGSVSTKLQEVKVPIMSNMDCKRTNYQSNRITDNMLCAGHKEGGKDSCQGDSGGPLHVVNQETGAVELVGVVSWGEGCAKPNYPGVYSRVNRYDTWIKTNTADACYCDAYRKK